MALPPDVLEKVTKAREYFTNNEDDVKKMIGDLSPAARDPAQKMMDIFMDSSKDLAAIKAEIEAIKASLSPDVQEELKKHREELSKKSGGLFCSQ